MARKTLIIGALALVLAGCGSDNGSQGLAAPEAPSNDFGFMEAQEEGISIMPPSAPEPVVERVTTLDIEEPAEAGMGEAANEQMPQGMPQIAYSYDYGFRVDTDKLSALQQQHADLCVSKGANVCRIISMNQSGSSGDYGYGRLHIEVVADQARDFGKELAAVAEGAGGEQISTSITGEDLSKQIVDTEARLRARTLLRDRLMEVLRSRNGTVAELVEAERGVAQVNEEIDQARSWLSEMRGRVAFSDVAISYETGTRNSGGFWEPIAWAFSSAGSAIGQAIGAIIMIFATLLPWVLVIGGGIWAWRRAGLPFWKRRKSNRFADAVPADEASEEGSP